MIQFSEEKVVNSSGSRKTSKKLRAVGKGGSREGRRQLQNQVSQKPMKVVIICNSTTYNKQVKLNSIHCTLYCYL